MWFVSVMLNCIKQCRIASKLKEKIKKDIFLNLILLKVSEFELEYLANLNFDDLPKYFQDFIIAEKFRVGDSR